MRRPRLRKRVAFIAQMEAAECGAASLAMILAWHGHHAPLPEVRQACGVSRDGASARAIVAAARSYGLEAQGLRAEPDQLAQLPLPAILHWDFGHFLVLEGLDRRGPTLVDPARGRLRVDWAEAGRRFTGAALVFRPTPALASRPRRRPSLARHREVLLRNLPGLAQVALATLALEGVGLAFPVASQMLVDRVLVPRQTSWLWGIALGLGGAGLAGALLGLVRGRAVLALGLDLDFALTSRFLGHLLRLPLGFFLQRDPGDLLQWVRANAALRDLLATQAVTALLDGLLLLGYGALMVALEPRLGALMIAVHLAEAGLLALLWARSRPVLAAGLAAAGREGAALIEALSGLETTKASGAEPRMVQRWAHRRVERAGHGLEQQRLDLDANVLLGLLQGAGACLLFTAGGRAVLDQHMTLGAFAAFLTIQGLFAGPVKSLLEALGRLRALGAGLERLDEVWATAPEPSGGADPGRLRGEVELRDVTFRYVPGGEPALDQVSVRIAPGEKVAVVGPSGSGKTTLARLMLGLHLPDRGQVRIDGRDLREWDLPRLRRQAGVVLQETFLFDATVRANLALHADGLPLERLQLAARLACVDEVIARLPGGFQARVGENGGLLSGGQRQRLGLARALAHDPAILVLDEATSALDLATEARIHANLAALGCTRILIAHRLATVRDADRILVLERGRIVQEGAYADLARRPGPFRDLLAPAGGEGG